MYELITSVEISSDKSDYGGLGGEMHNLPLQHMKQRMERWIRLTIETQTNTHELNVHPIPKVYTQTQFY